MTDFTDFQQKIKTLLPEIEIRFWEPMHQHTSFRIGGNAEVMAFPKTVDELAKILKISALLDKKPAILGAGTNVLAPDEGLPGIVICLKDCLDGMEQVGETTIRCMAGVTMARAAAYAANLGMTGMEWSHGIPGTIGGGLYMNAGAYGGEMGMVCIQAEVMDYSGNRQILSRKELQFSYRNSVIQHQNLIVTSGWFSLEKGDKEAIWDRMRQLVARRTASQPLNFPSAGSAFKRPAHGYAAALIESAGLKGYRVGNAAISEKHAGFAVNLGGATAKDVKKLLQQVSQRVYNETGVRLEPEIRIW